MKKQDNQPENAADLRQKAEALAREKAAREPEDITALSPEEIRMTLHELRVHQIELEMQNEELRRIQAELDAARARYFDLYDLAPVGYVTLSEPGLILEVNFTAATLLSVTRRALVKQPITRFILKEDQDIYYLHRKQLFETGAPQECDLRLVNPDGATFWAHLVATAAQATDGTPVCRLVMIDITERKRAEVEREKLEAQLRQAQKMETVGRLAGGVAHDFNNLLTAVIGNADLILGDMPKEDPLREEIEEIRNAGARAAGLTRQLLTFSRKQVLQPEVMNLNDTVRDLDRMLRRMIGEDIDLETDLAPEICMVEADVGQMEQVIMNLAVNARDAMPRGGKLTIQTANRELDEDYARAHIAVTPGPYVMLCVIDTGLGMPPEVQTQVFEPFFTTKGKGKGTGLGLATVYGIVKQSNGNIWVYSEPGKGTTFEIYLPRVEQPGRVMERQERKEETLQGSETILVVEDDEMVRNMTLKALRKYGYTVLCAGDGPEALRILRDHKGPIHLMVTDMVMPGISGKDLAEEAKAGHPGLKILFMSGYTDDAIVHHGVLEEGIAFIQKPFTPDGLARKVREVIGNAE